jgi:hypothetical protein
MDTIPALRMPAKRYLTLAEYQHMKRRLLSLRRQQAQLLHADDAVSAKRRERIALRIDTLERELAHAELLLPEEEPLTLREVADEVLGMARSTWASGSRAISQFARRTHGKLASVDSPLRSFKIS